MRRPVGLPPLQSEERTHRPIRRNRITHRLEGVELVASVGSGLEFPSQVHGRLRRVLDVVEAARRRLPDFEHRAGDRFPARRQHAAAKRRGLAGVLRGQVGPALARGRAFHVEGPKHRALGTAGGHPVVDGVDQHRDPERIGKEDELLPLFVAHLSRLGEEPDGRKPLLGCGLDLAHDRVQMADDALEDSPRPRVLATHGPRQDCLGEVCFGQVAHARSLSGGISRRCTGKKCRSNLRETKPHSPAGNLRVTTTARSPRPTRYQVP